MARLTSWFQSPRATAPGPLQRVYDAAATGWQDGIARLGFPDAYRHLMAQIPAPPLRPLVLDVGTGTGAFASAWVDTHGTPGSLTLTDLSPTMLQTAATRLPEADTVLAALGDPLPGLPPQDVVLCAHVIEHLDSPGATLRWLHDRLAPGGLLVLALSRPHWCTALVRWRWGNAAYTPEAATGLLRTAGFTDIAVHRFPAGPPARVSCGYVARRPD